MNDSEVYLRTLKMEDKYFSDHRDNFYNTLKKIKLTENLFENCKNFGPKWLSEMEMKYSAKRDNLEFTTININANGPTKKIQKNQVACIDVLCNIF